MIARYADMAGGLPLVVCPGRLGAAQSLGGGPRPQIGLTAASRSNFSRRRRRRRRARGPRDRGLRLPPKACRSSVLDVPRLRRPGRRQRADRELFRLSDRNFRPGADRARLHSGAEIRRRNGDPGRGQGARLLARRRRASLSDRGRRAHSRPDVVIASGARYRRPAIADLARFEGRGDLVLGLADRSAAVRRRGDRAGRRRQFGRSGRGLSLRPRLQSPHDGAAAGPRRKHVALPDRPHRGDAQHRTDDARPRSSR